MLRATLLVLPLLVCSFGCSAPTPTTAAPISAPAAATRDSAPAEPPPRLWLDLEPGPYRVGYRQELHFDPTRRYQSSLVETPGRPISIHRWYPADASGEPMRVANYLEIHSPESPDFAEQLERHAHNVLASEMLSVMDVVFASPAELALVESALAEPVFARRDAAPLDGRWPIVLYHPGLGGLYSDNFVLFELLASHGYLVISSSYVPNEGPDLRIGWDPKLSIADLDFVMRELIASGEWSNDTRAAVMGHSYGAQAALIYAMEGRRVDAVVSIDSTIENGKPDEPWFRRENIATWLDRGATIELPSLILAGEGATQTVFLDSMTAANRHYAIVPVLDHNDFLTHGGVLRPLFAHDTRKTELPASAFTRAHAWQLRTIHAFLDGVLKGDSTRLASLDDEWAAGLEGASIVYTAARESIERAEIVARFESEGIAGVVALCGPPNVERRCVPEVALNGLAYDFLYEAEPARAVALLRELVERYPDLPELQDSLGEALLHVGERDEAARAFDRAVEIATRINDPGLRFYQFRAEQAHRAAGSQ